MKSSMRFLALIFLFVFISECVFTQNAPGGIGGGAGAGFSSARGGVPPSPTFGVGPISNAVVTSAPYSAEGQSQNIRTLADGTHITTPLLHWNFYRDSLGRTRLERPVSPGNQFETLATQSQVAIEITDPVAQVKYTLDPIRKLIRQERWIPLTSAAVLSVLRSSRHGEQYLPAESLGTQSIEGILCEGTRNTTVWPVGAVGNDQPISVVSEVWKSSELQLNVLNKYNNPQTGELTQKLVNIVRTEPAASLFKPPAEYTIENGSTATPFPIGNGVSAPMLVFKVEPKYSEEARQAKYSGSVLLSIVVDTNGIPRDIKVVRPLGLGLDQKAIEALSQWRFRPGAKDGVAVAVMAQVEVSFRM